VGAGDCSSLSSGRRLKAASKAVWLRAAFDDPTGRSTGIDLVASARARRFERGSFDTTLAGRSTAMTPERGSVDGETGSPSSIRLATKRVSSVAVGRSASTASERNLVFLPTGGPRASGLPCSLARPSFVAGGRDG
jgi:hypothetical protein